MQTAAIDAQELPPRQETALPAAPPTTVLAVLTAISFSHLLNDALQALMPSLYPMLKDSYQLSFAQLGWITFTYQLTASLLQPLIGFVTDKKPMPHSLAVGMGFTFVGIIALSLANSFPFLLAAAALIGLGSAVFHPGASRVAHMAAGPRRGFAQSFFQLGGNAGSSLGPLLAAAVVVSRGQGHIAWFAILAFIAIVVLWCIGTWQARNYHRISHKAAAGAHPAATLPRRKVTLALGVLVSLIFSKYVYLTSMVSYYTFYLIHRFGVQTQTAQVLLFVFLGAVAAGTIIGGPVGDRIGRKRVIWASILGMAPFSLVLPHVGLTGVVILSVIIGVIMASAFSAIVVYAQDLVPGKVGMIAGLFFGLAFGVAGIGSAALGFLADHTSIEFVFSLCAWLPLLGMLAVFLPDVEPVRKGK
jgi:FSR family fosmidomycin resistance protein-like MFS transporter